MKVGLSLHQILSLFLAFTLTRYKCNALLEPVNSNRKIHALENVKRSVLTGSSLFLLYTSSIAKAPPALGQSIEFPDSAAFYQKYQYREPKDILSYIEDCEIKDGNAVAVTDALETFSKYYPMYKLSREKVNILKDEVKKFQPKNVLEIGTFFGYSALNMGTVLPSGASLTCIEANKNNADVARVILDKGLGVNSKARESVRIIDGISSKVLNSNENLLGKIPFDFVFLDHDKDCYLTDLKTLEDSGMLASNCMIVADNVVFPGAPGYLEYVSGENSNISDQKPVEKSTGRKGQKSPIPRIPKGR
jgi:catechol O-methyltransferase